MSDVTNITGKITDSSGAPLKGKLTVKINYNLTNPNTTPVSLITTEPKTYNIVNGLVDLNLYRSDVENITYNFNFDILRDVDNYEYLFDFDSVVPNVPLVSFSSLVPTNFSVDHLNTSLFTIANLLTSNENYAEKLRYRPKLRGQYDNAAFYDTDDVVYYGGSSFIYINSIGSVGNTPPTYPGTGNDFWSLNALRGDTGAGTTGVDTGYGSNWSNSNDAPTKARLFEKIQTLAFRDNPVLTGNVIVPTQNVRTANTNAANTAFVTNNFNTGNFIAKCSGTLALNDDGVWNNFIFNSSDSSNFNTSTGTYTAPFNGYYLFTVNMHVATASGFVFNSLEAEFYFDVALDDFTHTVFEQSYFTTAAQTTKLSCSFTVQQLLNANDKVYFRVKPRSTATTGTGSPIVYANGSTTSNLKNTFSGICLYRN